jgi:hypothetical protein
MEENNRLAQQILAQQQQFDKRLAALETSAKTPGEPD